MIIKGVIDEDFANYKKPSMLISAPCCTMKCGAEYCQNHPLLKKPDTIITAYKLAKRYLQNNLTHAVVFGGLEPMDTFGDILDFVRTLRLMECKDDIVIYTGYNKEEISTQLMFLKYYSNIIIKFGRYIPGQQPHYDEVLGVYLASDNQYGEKVS